MAEIGKDRLVELSDAKLQDAKLLLDAGRPGNAYYLAGYAVELMLKAILATQFKADTLPDRTLLRDVFTHDLAKLLRLGYLEEELKLLRDANVLSDSYWQIALNWSETSRYQSRSLEEARGLIEAIEHSEHGVLSWLRCRL